ncbi:hypothetical protein [Candidatus Bathycorpusculum sp.]|uniref:hypothetical protein n=1 Tax=Candidatus Bathycorpusculum sp. TaxID=2994959 RepID=UPI0028347C6E|nr:hypothetical protein [Candidatus Termitimicrobium sp.]MCL2685940.1 hypothetical protein [Candidatus Termitimicrobium sp.]
MPTPQDPTNQASPLYALTKLNHTIAHDQQMIHSLVALLADPDIHQIQDFRLRGWISQTEEYNWTQKIVEKYFTVSKTGKCIKYECVCHGESFVCTKHDKSTPDYRSKTQPNKLCVCYQP